MHISRRVFVRHAAAGSAAGLLLCQTPRVYGANERIVMAAIGCGGQGTGLAKSFAGRPQVEMAYVCDPDQRRAENAAREVEQASGRRPSIVRDLRRVLDDLHVDAVTVATPDHWHAPAAILACQAGKHVYVEKPCSHNVREGRLLVDAARQHKRIVQHGTQSRSNPLIAGAVQLLRDGIIGDVLMARAWNIQRRGNIGHQLPTPAPAHVDYDMWVGPASYLPYQENRFHYNWHWWYNFGTGDAGNDGVHEIDYARWGLGVDSHPTTISSLGGKFHHDDDQQFPDTMTAVFQYPGDGRVGSQRQLIFEMRLWSTNYPYGVDSGAEFHGTEGKLFVSKRGKLQIWGQRNEPIDAAPPQMPELLDHHEDFLDAIVRGRKPNAEIAVGHLSASLCHLANISTRLGRSLQFDPATELIQGDDQASQLLSREYRSGGHWAVPAGI